jgi:autotransporter-associated beta strand protein
LTFDGGFALVNGFSSVGTGLTIVNAPVVFNSPLTITQNDNDILDFRQSLSGAGGLSINRGAGTYSTIVGLSAENTYSGASTTLTGSAADDSLVVRLGHVNAIPASTNITLTQSAILELAAGEFTRGLGTAAGEIQFSGSGRNGWGAFGADRVVNLGGAGTPVTWGSGAGQANFGQLVLGNTTSNAMVDFKNPLDLNGNRNNRSYDGTAPIDGRISGSISGTGNLTKINDGVLSLAAANSYMGNTIVQGGMLQLDHQNALPSASNLQLGSGGVLAIGADTAPGDPASDFARDLGTSAGQIQLTTIGGGGNATNAGFSAYGGDRSVVLSGGAALTWGAGSFLQGTGNRNFILSAEVSDATLDFQNPIDLAGANRTVVARNGSAVVDARLSGVISGAGAASGLIKDNPGTLELSAANTYGGITRVTAGVLLLTNASSIPGGITGDNTGNIEVNSSNPNNTGVIGLGLENFTSGLGTGPGQFQIVGNGGFAAFGDNRSVNLGGAGAQVTWATGGFASANLALGATTADATVDFQNPIDFNAATRVVQARNGTAAIDGVLSGVLSGAGGGLDKQGGGTLALTGANTYDGGTLVTEGRLLVNNTSGSGVGVGDVAVNQGTLGGTGFIGTLADASNVALGAGTHLAPGASAGELTVFGDVTFSGTSFFDIEVGGAAAGSQIDKLTVNGIATLGGTLNVDLLNGFLPAGGTSFEILSASGGRTGTFSNVTWTGPTPWRAEYGPTTVTLIAGFTGDYDEDFDVDSTDLAEWTTDFGLASGASHLQGDGNGDGDVDGSDFLIWQSQFGGDATATAAAMGVPEPSSFVLLAFAGASIGLQRRRRRRRT